MQKRKRVVLTVLPPEGGTGRSHSGKTGQLCGDCVAIWFSITGAFARCRALDTDLEWEGRWPGAGVFRKCTGERMFIKAEGATAKLCGLCEMRFASTCEAYGNAEVKRSDDGYTFGPAHRCQECKDAEKERKATAAQGG